MPRRPERTASTPVCETSFELFTKTVSDAGRLRIVLDTNVYVSAFNGPERGNPFRIWRAAAAHHFVLLVSPHIVEETGRDLRTRFTWDDRRVAIRIKELTGLARIVVPKVIIDAITRDPDDNHILECAVAGNADLIVSGDLDLLDMKSFRRIAIIRPSDFRRILGSKAVSPTPRRA